MYKCKGICTKTFPLRISETLISNALFAFLNGVRWGVEPQALGYQSRFCCQVTLL